MADLKPDRRTAVVTLTHDPKLDDPALQAALTVRRLLYRRARQPEDPCAQRLARLKAAGFDDAALRPHPWAGRPRHRRASRRPRSPFPSWRRSPPCGVGAGRRQRREQAPHDLRRSAGRRGRGRAPRSQREASANSPSRRAASCRPKTSRPWRRPAARRYRGAPGGRRHRRGRRRDAARPRRSPAPT